MTLHRPLAVVILGLPAVLAGLTAARPALALTRNWSGGVLGGGSFESPDSWSNGVPVNNTTSDVASFQGFATGPAIAAVNFPAGRSVGGLAINSPTGGVDPPGFTFSGLQLTLGDAGIVVDPAAGTGHRIENSVALGTSQTWNIGSRLTVAGSISGSGRLTKTGGGTLRIEGTGGWTGGTHIQSGTVEIAGGAALADTGQVFFPSASTGTLDLDASERIGGLDSASNAAAAAVLLGGHTLTIGGFAGTSNFRNGSITGTGRLVKLTGTVQIISTGTTYSGGTTISAGELRIDNTTGSALGSGMVTVNGTGQLSGGGSISGPAVVEGGGRISPGVNLQNGGTLRVGSLDLASATSGGLEYNIAPAGASNDFVAVTGAATLGGKLALLPTTSFTPALADSWELLSAASAAGQFVAIDFPGLPADLGLRTRFVDSMLSIAVVLPGDYNGDLAVDAADFTVWRDTLGQTGGNVPADGNSDFTVNQADYDLWKQHFGLTLFDLGSAAAADYNGNGLVDAADFTVWRDTLGQTGDGLAADGFGPTGVPDGVVDQFDYRFWKARFGEAVESGSAAAYLAPGDSSVLPTTHPDQAVIDPPPVPEPTGIAILSLGIVALLATCRAHQRRRGPPPRNAARLRGP
jgi:autotransporter-associated beta strand protein